LVFSTTADGAASPTERMQVTSGGVILIGNSTPSGLTGRVLQVGDTGNSESYVEVRSSTSGATGIVFSDGTASDNTGYRGTLEYNHSSNSLVLKAAATTALTLDSSQNATFAGSVTDSKGELRKIIKADKSSAYVIVASDSGKVISISTGGVTVNASVMSGSEAVTIINHSGSDQTITQGSGMTMYNTGDAATGNRTLAGRGMCTIWYQGGDTSYIGGAGLS